MLQSAFSPIVIMTMTLMMATIMAGGLFRFMTERNKVRRGKAMRTDGGLPQKLEDFMENLVENL